MRAKIYYVETCPGCGRPADAPYRCFQGGAVVMGCVNEFHTGHLVTPSASASWHARPEAKRIRSADKAARGGFISKPIKYASPEEIAKGFTLP
jgi:hypothetical protein